MDALENQIRLLEQANLVSVRPQEKGDRIFLNFSEEPPETPGVYVIYENSGSQSPEPFYVGEARNLRQRLVFLFRCNSSNNPHPCHFNWAKKRNITVGCVKCEEFCSQFTVRFLSTAGLVGRLEVEEALQQRFGTNCDEFYKPQR